MLSVKQFTYTQRMFMEWNAKRLYISITESERRYLDSLNAINNGHRGKEFREFGGLSHRLFKVFYDNSKSETFATYQFHGALHFLRMLSYPERKWTGEDTVIQNLNKCSPITIVDFGCGLAQHSRGIAVHLLERGIRVNYVLADIPTLCKEFLIWLGGKIHLATTFLDCTADDPIPALPKCDLIIATEFFEHVHDPLMYFDRFYDVMRPNGLLMTNVADRSSEFMHVCPDLESLRRRIQAHGCEEILPNVLYAKK